MSTLMKYALHLYLIASYKIFQPVAIISEKNPNEKTKQKSKQ